MGVAKGVGCARTIALLGVTVLRSPYMRPLLFLVLSFGFPMLASAQEHLGDPRAYSLRMALMPLTFQPGISASLVGSAARGEVDPWSSLTLQLTARVPWFTAAGQDAEPAFRLSGRAGVMWHFLDDAVRETAATTIQPHDASVVSPSIVEAGHDIRTVQQRMGGPRMHAPLGHLDADQEVSVRHVQSLRLFYDYSQSVQRRLPREDPSAYELNRAHALSLGYGFGSQWNVPAGSAKDDPKVGFKRYYVDLLLTTAALVRSHSLGADGEAGTSSADFMPVGARIGLEGGLCGMLRGWPGLGLAYALELGAWPGRSGLEGYLFLGLGIEVDVSPGRPRV